MQLKIISDGTTYNTKVVDVETNKELKNVTKIDWSIAVGGQATVRLELIGVAVDVQAKMDLDTDTAELIKIDNGKEF